LSKIDLLKFCKDLYKIPRSITGNGVVKSLEYIQQYIPIEIKSVKSGTNAFDWIVPPEWNIREAYIINLSTGKKVIDFKIQNLHVMGYSQPINLELSYNELIKNIHFIKDQPDAIPYVTSYYSKSWGFCMSYNSFKKLDKSSNYKAFIDSDFNKNGNLTYGELLIKGKVEKEIFLSSYICHPQMVNNELSGPAVLTGIADYLINKSNYYSYRFVLIPETIGSIVYLSKNIESLKKNVVGGFNITCVGDERSWGLIPSRYGNNISDKIAEKVLSKMYPAYIKYSWLDRGSDERQYCAPGVDLPICSITRTKYGEYPEYHTSLDDFDLVTSKGLEESLNVYIECIKNFELNKEGIYPKINVLGEPQLSKRRLYPTISKKNSSSNIHNFMNVISYCDGKNELNEISKLCNIDYSETYSIYLKLKEHNLLH
tara:strand:- start:912 stop:2192 length:1281 start_codon:yes stop_codon:yes gene_type:complete